MEELLHEFYVLCGKLGRTTDPHKRWELECEIENLREEIYKGGYTDD